MTETLKIEFESDSKQKSYVKGEGQKCRLCLSEGASLKIFNEDLLLVHKIQRCCELKMFQDDGFPDHICSKCCSTIEISLNFKSQCLESDRILRSLSNLPNEEVKCDVKEECFSDDNLNNNNYNDDYDSLDDYEPEKKTKKKKARSLKKLGQYGHTAKRKMLRELEIKDEENDIITEYFYDDKSIPDKRKKVSSKSTLCSFCGKMFNKSTSLNAHIKTHRTDRPFTCDICSKTFFEKWHLHEHKKIHTDVKSYPCEACGKLFKTPRDTKRHMDTVHKKMRAVQCKLCRKYLSSGSGLKLHMKSHTGEKEFQCHICMCKFISKPCLTLHLRVHTGEKPYSCKFCEGKFAILKTLKEHERIHTGETPYNCPVCKKGFSQKSNMKSHIRYNHRGVEFSLEKKSLVDSTNADAKDPDFDAKDVMKGTVIFRLADETTVPGEPGSLLS